MRKRARAGDDDGIRRKWADETSSRSRGAALTMALDANGHPVSRIAQRKLEHLRLSLEASVQSTRGAGFERFAFTHQALPELDLDAIDTRTSFMAKPLKLPFLISSITAGAQAPCDINPRLRFGRWPWPAWPRSMSPGSAAAVSAGWKRSGGSGPRKSSSPWRFPSGASPRRRRWS